MTRRQILHTAACVDAGTSMGSTFNMPNLRANKSRIEPGTLRSNFLCFGRRRVSRRGALRLLLQILVEQIRTRPLSGSTLLCSSEGSSCTPRGNLCIYSLPLTLRI